MDLTRLHTILYLTDGTRYPSLNEISDYLRRHKDKDVSDRTLKRDIELLRDEFSISIKYDASGGKNGGYYINRAESLEADKMIRFIQHMNASQLITRIFDKNGLNKNNYISTAQDSNPSGALYLEQVLYAITKHTVIKFKYTKFSSDEPEVKEVEPYFLKEFNDTWYLHGKDKIKDAFRTYGMDRISDLTVTKESFKRDTQKKPHLQFGKLIGIFLPPHTDTMDILLKVTGPYVDTLKSRPFHSSQIIRDESQDHLILSLELIPNGELYSELLKMREYVTVINPPELRDKISGILRKTLDNYTV